MASNGSNQPCQVRRDTPDDVVVWIKKEANRHHKGVSASVLENLEEVPNEEQRWEEYQDKHQIRRFRLPSTPLDKYW
jgi:hypothetical protein